MIELIDYMLIGAGLGVAFCTYWAVRTVCFRRDRAGEPIRKGDRQ